MRRTRSTSDLLLICGLAAGVACDDPLRPKDVAGTYVLRTVRNDPLPAVLWESDGASLRILADTLVLNADGTGYEVSHLEFTTQLQTTAARSESPLTFAVRDGRLEGSYSCAPGTACLGILLLLRGELTPIGLRLDVGKDRVGPLFFHRATRSVALAAFVSVPVFATSLRPHN
jgi:hypothetical protein